MKRTILITLAVFVFTMIALFFFNKLTSRQDRNLLFTEAVKGDFEVSISVPGEILAENAVDIKAPEVSRGRDFRAQPLRITDMVAEGTIVNTGDYVATLDRTQYDNTLKDERERLSEYRNNIEMKKLDTAVTLTNLRNNIRNQIHTVEEAEITLRNSKFEPPATIRQAEIDVERQQRMLEQRKRGYELRVAQAKRDLIRLNTFYNRVDRRVASLEEILAGFTITAPSPGMVVYKRDRRGTKIKTGSNVNMADRIVATLPDLSSLLSQIYISEIEIRKIEPGQNVEIRVDAFPNKTFSGKVYSVANIGEQLGNSDSKVFEVMVRLDAADPDLRPAMTTSNKVVIQKYSDVIYIPTECIHAEADGIPFVYTKDKAKQIVVTGDVNDRNTIIEQGLKPKQAVYILTPENADDFIVRGEELKEVYNQRMTARK